MTGSPADGVAQRRWFRSGPDLVWERGLAEGIVFDPVSGETHFLSDLPALILSVIDEMPASYTELVERFAGPVDLDGGAQSQIVAALLFLEGAELVESQPI